MTLSQLTTLTREFVAYYNRRHGTSHITHPLTLREEEMSVSLTTGYGSSLPMAEILCDFVCEYALYATFHATDSENDTPHLVIRLYPDE